jgi:hypothetical protein
MLVLACFLLVATPPSAALAIVVTYYSAAFCANNSGGDTAGLAVRDYNRVYRPAGNTFKLYYAGGQTYYDTWSNPFVTPASVGVDSAGCRNNSGGTVANVTCQTTT